MLALNSPRNTATTSTIEPILTQKYPCVSARELLGFSAALLAAPIFQISGTGTSNVSGLTDANRREAVGLAPSASRLAMFFTACNGEPVQHL